MRAAEAAPVLSAKVGLEFDVSHVIIKHLPAISARPAADALVKIGSPAIPAIIQNLRESDDSVVRDFSVKVLCKIEGDTAVAQFRVRRAMELEEDPARKARLQGATEQLRELNVGNPSLR